MWLGRANLALRTGHSDEAEKWLAACLGRRPEDPAVWQAQLDWALATEQVGEVNLSWYNVGAAYEAEPVTFSVNFGHCFACEQDDREHDLKVYNLVFGAELAIAPGLTTSIEVSIFDESIAS